MREAAEFAAGHLPGAVSVPSMLLRQDRQPLTNQIFKFKNQVPGYADGARGGCGCFDGAVVCRISSFW